MSLSFQSKSVFDIRPNWEEISNGQLDDNSFEGGGPGLQTPWKVTTKVRRRAKLSLLLGTREEVTEARTWILARGMRRDAFWLPLYLNDYGLTQDASASDTTILVKNIGLAEKFSYGEQFRYLALVNFDKLECYEIERVEDLGDEERITLTTGLASDLNASATTCCGLMLGRLADDELEFDMQTDGVARLALNVVELPSEFSGSYTSAPIYLYRVTRGELSWHFCSWPETVEVASLDWQALNITHGDFTQNSEFTLRPLKISVVTDDPDSPFRVALDRNVSELTTIEIFETDFDTLTTDLDAPLYKGRMGRSSFNDKGGIDIELSTILRIGEAQVPTLMIQRPCNNRLFDTFCGLNAEDFAITGTISAMSDDPPSITATEFGDKATAESDDDWFALGRVLVNGEIRFCVGQNGNTLYLNARFRTASVGASAVAYPGCDKRTTTCDVKFDNIENNLGFAVIPNKAPQFEAISSPKPGGGKK